MDEIKIYQTEAAAVEITAQSQGKQEMVSMPPISENQCLSQDPATSYTSSWINQYLVDEGFCGGLWNLEDDHHQSDNFCNKIAMQNQAKSGFRCLNRNGATMENITASEVAGFGVGTLLLCATIAAPKVDAFISASQRSSLGLCKKCGGLQVIACSRCRGTGLTKANGPFSLNLIDNLYQSEEFKVNSVGCTKCQAKGHFSCPECSNASTS